MSELEKHLIKVLEFKPGKRYILIAEKKSGLKPQDLANLSSKYFADVAFIVDDIDGLHFIERDKIE